MHYIPHAYAIESTSWAKRVHRSVLPLKQSYDVIVVGAGPAGATLAYQLAKKGIGVLVLEKESLPRYKCCAGGVTAKAAKLLDFDISGVAEDVVCELSVTYDLGNPYLGQHSKPLIYTVMRDEFDYLLVNRAQQCGAVVIDRQEVTQVQMNADGVEVSTSDSIFRAQVVAGADGAYSAVARKLDMKRNIEYVAGMEMQLVAPEEELAKRKSRAEIDLGCSPQCYAWMFPKRKHFSIGAMCPTSSAGDLKHCCQKFLSSLRISKYTIARASSHMIPTCRGKALVSQDKALLVGDAAGLADPLTGEGIHNAIQSAQLAAAVIESSLAQGKIELHDYQQAVEEKIVPEMRIARTLSRILRRFPRLALRMLDSDDRVWKGWCYLLRGDMDYSTIKEKLGGFKGMFASLFSV